MVTGLGEQRRDIIGNVNKVIKKKKKREESFRCRITKRPPVVAQPAVPVTLQRLFVSGRDIFKGPAKVPSPTDVQKLCRILDRMLPEDVGLSRDLQFFKRKGSSKKFPRVAYTEIYESTNFSLCIFFLPATAVIPLHNHPGMTVFSKLLLGTMHIKAYDWVNADDSVSSSSSQARLARLKTNNVFKAPCNTSVLYPTSGGNIHAFTAITPCAVLDVIGPPYSKEDGRDCSYYKDSPCYDALSDGKMAVAKKESGSYGWLEKTEMPKELEMDIIEYLGPQIIET